MYDSLTSPSGSCSSRPSSLSTTSSLLLFSFFFLTSTHSDLLYLLYSSFLSFPHFSRYNSILTHPCCVDYCFRISASTVPFIQSAPRPSLQIPSIRAAVNHAGVTGLKKILPCARPKTSIIYEGTKKSIPPSSARRWSQPTPLLLQASVDLLRVASPWSSIENPLYHTYSAVLSCIRG